MPIPTSSATSKIFTHLRNLIARLQRSEDGNIAIFFALATIPLIGAAGAAVDFSQANNVKARLQAALDAAVLAGAKNQTSNWDSVALNTFNSSVVSKGAAIAAPTFTLSDSKYQGAVTASVPTAFLGLLGIASVTVSAHTIAMGPTVATGACLLALDPGKPLSDQGIQFNGSPSVNMAGCTIRSNTSLSCSGNSIGTVASIAAGSASGCTNPKSNSYITPDIYASLASNITAACGGSKLGATWSPGNSPPPASMKTVSKGSYTEYHICGDLNLSGRGSLFGNAPSSDSVIIIENGSVTLADNASVSAMRTAFVLTGDNSAASSINFPNGNGQSATLSMSPPTDTTNPWHGMALYQDPSLTNGIDDNWGPGATLIVDGVIYLPKSNVTMKGVGTSNSVGCTVLVVGTFTTNGTVNLTQSASGCASLNVNQYTGTEAYLTQ